MIDQNETVLEIRKGATESIEIQILDEDNAPVDISDWTIYFTAKEDITDSDDDAIIKKDVTPGTDASSGKVTIALTSTDTNKTVGQYIYGISAKTNLLEIYPDFQTGNLVIKEITSQRMIA
jgi:hypothetical protein